MVSFLHFRNLLNLEVIISWYRFFLRIMLVVNFLLKTNQEDFLCSICNADVADYNSVKKKKKEVFIIRCPGFPSDSHACSLSQSLLFLTKPFASCCKLAGNSCVDEAESWNCSLYSTSLLQTSVLAATALLRSMSAPC